MSDFNLGQAHGIIQIGYDGSGVTAAKKDIDSVGATAGSVSGKLGDLGRVSAVAGGLVAAGFGLAIGAAANLEERLSAIEAVSGATAAEMESVRQKALQLGADTKFSAGDAAIAMEELAKAGLRVDDILGGAADAAVNLAAAGEIDLPQAATIAANAMNQFGLAAEKLPHVADLIAGAANASAIDVSEFGQSMQQSGAVANLVGLSFDDLTTAIALMGNAGIRGSDAGTSLKTMLSNLQPVTAKQTAEFERLGLVTEDGTNRFFDARGSVKSLSDIAGILSDSLANASDKQKALSLEMIFGSDAIRAAAVLTEAGAEGFDKLGESINKVSAADVAATRMDNLKGSVEQLKGSVETLSVTFGTPLLGALRVVTDSLTNFANFMTELPGPVRTIITVVAGLVGVVLALGGAFLLLTPRIAATSAALSVAAKNGSLLAATGIKMVGVMGPLSAVLAVATIGLAYFANKQQESKQQADDLRNSLDQQTGAITQNTRAVVSARLEDEGYLDTARSLGLNLEDVTSAALGNEAALKRLNEQANAGIAPFDAASESVGDYTRRVIEASPGMGDLLIHIGALTTETGLATEEQKRIAEAIGETKTKVDESIPGLENYGAGLGTVSQETANTTAATEAVNAAVGVFNDSLNRLFKITFGVSAAEDELSTKVHTMEQAILDAHQAVLDGTAGAAEYNRTLEGSSQAAIDNRDSLRDMVDGLGKVAQAGIEAGDTEAEVTQKYQDGRDALIEKLVQLGYNEEAVRNLIETEGDVQPLIDTYFATTGLDDATTRVGLHDDTIRGVPLAWDSVFAADTEDASLKANTFSRLADDATVDRTTVFTVLWDVEDWGGPDFGGGGVPWGGRQAGSGSRSSGSSSDAFRGMVGAVAGGGGVGDGGGGYGTPYRADPGAGNMSFDALLAAMRPADMALPAWLADSPDTRAGRFAPSGSGSSSPGSVTLIKHDHFPIARESSFDVAGMAADLASHGPFDSMQGRVVVEEI